MDIDCRELARWYTVPGTDCVTYSISKIKKLQKFKCKFNV